MDMMGDGVYAFALSSLLWLSHLKKRFVWLRSVFRIFWVVRGEFLRVCPSSLRRAHVFVYINAIRSVTVSFHAPYSIHVMIDS